MDKKQFDIAGAIKHGVVISGCYYVHTGLDKLTNLPRFAGHNLTRCRLGGLPLVIILTAAGTVLSVRKEGGFKREMELTATVAQPRTNELKTVDISTRYKVGDFVWFVTDRDGTGKATTVQRGLVLPEVTIKVNTENQTREVRHALQVVKNGMARTFRVLDTDFVEVDAK